MSAWGVGARTLVPVDDDAASLVPTLRRPARSPALASAFRVPHDPTDRYRYSTLDDIARNVDRAGEGYAGLNPLGGSRRASKASAATLSRDSLLPMELPSWQPPLSTLPSSHCTLSRGSPAAAAAAAVEDEERGASASRSARIAGSPDCTSSHVPPSLPVLLGGASRRHSGFDEPSSTIPGDSRLTCGLAGPLGDDGKCTETCDKGLYTSDWNGDTSGTGTFVVGAKLAELLDERLCAGLEAIRNLIHAVEERLLRRIEEERAERSETLAEVAEIAARVGAHAVATSARHDRMYDDVLAQLRTSRISAAGSAQNLGGSGEGDPPRTFGDIRAPSLQAPPSCSHGDALAAPVVTDNAERPPRASILRPFPDTPTADVLACRPGSTTMETSDQIGHAPSARWPGAREQLPVPNAVVTKSWTPRHAYTCDGASGSAGVVCSSLNARCSLATTKVATADMAQDSNGACAMYQCTPAACDLWK